MKRLVCMVVAAMTWHGSVQSQQPARTWQVCLPDHAVLPYLNAPGKPAGVTQRLIADAAARVHLAVAFVRVPSTRCLVMLRTGMVDATLSGAAEENLQTLRFPLRDGKPDASKRAAALRQVWVKRREYALDWDGKNLLHVAPHNVRVGTLHVNRVAEDSLRPLGVVIDNGAYDAEQLLRKLEARRVDAAVLLEDEFVALRQDPVTRQLSMLAQPLRAVDYFLAARPSLSAPEQAQMEAWWTAIAALRDTPAYKPR